MVDRSKKITGRFYMSATGRRPVREWLLRLPKSDRQAIGKDIQKVEFGWPIGMPYCRPLGHGLWEVRSDLTGGRIARVGVLHCRWRDGAPAWFREKISKDAGIRYRSGD
jgi:hypothetical protein